MIPKECKRLAEVDFPIAVVSKWAAKEKSIRHGHPSTLHLWWARRPLAACRAMLMALLLPDTCDEHCPPEFKLRARELLRPVQREIDPTDKDLQKAIIKFIGDFANWDLAANRTYLEVSRGLVKAAHGHEPPLVVDPFAGGGSIPLEALRLGCDAFASDLNPVACLILKVILEAIPRYGPKFGQDIRRIGSQIKTAAEEKLVDLYPPDSDGARPIAYLWARTARCESPNCGAEIPLVRSFWLCDKAGRKRALKCEVKRLINSIPLIEFEVFEPTSEQKVPNGTVRLAKATCIACGSVLPPDRLRAQLARERGGADVVFDSTGRRIGGATMLAVVTASPGEHGRRYRIPMQSDYRAVRNAQERLAAVVREWEATGQRGLCPVPTEPTPQDGTGSVGGGFRTRKYGLKCFGDFFTARQSLALLTLTRLIREWPEADDGAIRSAMAMILGRSADYGSSGVVWAHTGEFVAHTFGRQALPMVWDFAEPVPWSDSSGNLDGAIDWVARVIQMWPGSQPGHVECADATQHPLPDQAATVWFSDPPYYDSVPYADLSDFFFVWLKRLMLEDPLFRDLVESGNPLTPKIREAVRDEQDHLDGRPKKTIGWYERTMHHAFVEGRRLLTPDGIGCIVFAHKSTEGWEALLSGITKAGWIITGSWPIATERPGRLRSQDSAALATSVHLICRPRIGDQVGDWDEVYREIPKRVGDWMERLQSEGVRGADLVFACIGPALEIYSRYSKVVDAEEHEIPLGGDPEATEPHKRGYLAYVWESVGRAALEQVLGTAEARARNGAAGALEEDARLTALFLWTLQSTDSEPGNGDAPRSEHESEDEDDEEAPRGKKRGLSLIFDVVRRFAQPLGIRLPDWEGRIIETDKGIVRLLPVAERAKQLFGQDGAQAVADQLERNPKATPQLTLFPEGPAERTRGIKGRRKATGAHVSDEALQTQREATTLDRIHAAMLLQVNGRANALRALLKAEHERGPEFERLANALSALYPKNSEEKRLLDAMLLALPR